MKTALALSLAIITVLPLAGCITDDRQAAAAQPLTRCEIVAALLSSRSATPGQIATAMEVGRNNGCFGKAPPTTIIVR